MATLDQLVHKGDLVRYEAALEADEQPERFIYCSPKFEDWVLNVLGGLERDRGRDLTPLDQVELAFFEFIVGRPMVYGRTHRKLEPFPSHIWELKTDDVRLIGWFVARATYIVVAGTMRKSLPRFKDYRPFLDSAEVFRSGLDLDAPKMITGVTLNDIL